jgi:uncharacterized membrane protein HdeD (DUF308 family)
MRPDDALLERWPIYNLLHRSWQWLFLRGVLATIFGVVVLVWPGPALLVLTIAFGIWVFSDGILALINGFAGREHVGLLVAEGIIGIALGIMTLYNPLASAIALYSVIAIWSIVIGFMRIINGIRLRREIANEGWMILGGIAAIGFGILLLALPQAGALAIAWLVGIYGIIEGIIFMALAMRMKEVSNVVRPSQSH